MQLYQIAFLACNPNHQESIREANLFENELHKQSVVRGTSWGRAVVNIHPATDVAAFGDDIDVATREPEMATRNPKPVEPGIGMVAYGVQEIPTTQLKRQTGSELLLPTTTRSPSIATETK